MNAREEARRMAEVMLAFAGGADVQRRLYDDDPWNDTGVPDWDWELCDYRVKPKPREEWRIVDKYGDVWGTYDGTDVARRYAGEYARNFPSSAPFRIVHMREVTE